MAGDEDYISGRRPDRIYFSKEFPRGGPGESRPARFMYRVFEGGERDGLIEIKKEVVIRVTSAGRQQIKALFYIDDRQIETLTLQRFSAGSDKLHPETQFCLRGDEIDKLLELATLIRVAGFTGQDRVRIDEADLEKFTITKAAKRASSKSWRTM
ncbi:MAG: hypothetical protein HY238_14605 [Acidobacteria bacterium]|nr:hypothetical protein [Acidobacteriota bacterium]